MAGRYIPPHMRGSTGSSSAEKPMVKAERKPEDGYTLEEIANQFSFDHKKKLGTLNRASISVEEEETPNLGFVIVFKDQHPKWPPKIFCKTYLFLLPKTETLPSTYISRMITLTHAPTRATRLQDRVSGANCFLEPQYPAQYSTLFAGQEMLTSG